MVGEALLYCLQSRLWGRGGGPGGAEGSISAGGCSFNSFLRRTVRFVGEWRTRPSPSASPPAGPLPGPDPPSPQASTCSACAPRPW